MGLAISLSYNANQQSQPAVSYDGNNYFVVWDDFHLYSYDVYGTLIDSTGMPITDTAFAIESDLKCDKMPYIAYNQNNYLCTWGSTYAWQYMTKTDISGKRINILGVIIDSTTIVILPETNRPSICSGNQNYLVTGERFYSYYETFGTIHAAIINQNGSIDTSFRITQPINGVVYRNSRTAFDGINYLVVYDEYFSGIFGQFVSQNGNLIGPQFSISTQGTRPDVAFGDSIYLVVWDDGDICGRMVSCSGGMVDTSFVICNAPGSQCNARVCWNGFFYYVLWEDNRAGNWDIYGAKLSSNGIVVDTFSVITQHGDQVAPSILCNVDGNLFIVYSGWTDFINGRPAKTMRIWGKFYPFTGIEENTGKSMPRNYRLDVYPNPFKNALMIRLQIPDNGLISSQYSVASIKIYDASGRLVKTFSDIQCSLNNSVGYVLWSGEDDSGCKLPAGVYFVKLETKYYETVKKMVLLR